MALPTGDLVPTESERDALLAALGRLLDRAGPDRFLTGPIFLPCDEHFPEPFRASRRGVRRLVQRLLAYVGLSMDANVDIFDSFDPHDELDDEGNICPLPRGAAAYTAGIRDGRAHVVVDLRQLDALDRLVGVLAHEVTHLYREHHGMMALDRDAEEMLTDLTSLYLGFGVFVANNAYRYRTEGGLVDGAAAYNAWSEERLGYLSPAALTYLLAVQLELHATPPQVDDDLDPTQRMMLQAARNVLPPKRELAVLLGIDLEAERAPIRDAVELANAYVPAEQETGDEDDDVLLLDDRIVAENAGASLLKLRQTRLSPMAVGGVGGLVVGGVLADTFGLGMWLLVAGLLFAGWRLGKVWPYYQCLGEGCDAIVPRDVDECPRCGGRFARIVDDYSAILED
jgi:hypothetical protein